MQELQLHVEVALQQALEAAAMAGFSFACNSKLP